MSMTRAQIVTTAAGGSALLLVGAFMFQIIGYPPCEMCLWQRWPHAFAFVIGIAFLVIPSRILALLGGITVATSGAIGVYHAGVEQKWWEGPTSCTSGDISNLTPEQLLEQIMSAPLVRCDDIAWALAGISMAGWNAIISFFLAGLWVVAARRFA
ncbi:disulfide bond formation protein DsbB [Litoreibacter meonggei]|uniref:Disulfide bond formation protein DsbB n=1 Tax=Litoreibacter meonggei TaxID=1049199 RepID=A0A497VXR9_9RHOB|nr:disulfide bond formation protein DsbB [Litoreibacter meonggei]